MICGRRARRPVRPRSRADADTTRPLQACPRGSHRRRPLSQQACPARGLPLSPLECHLLCPRARPLVRSVSRASSSTTVIPLASRARRAATRRASTRLTAHCVRRARTRSSLRPLRVLCASRALPGRTVRQGPRRARDALRDPTQATWLALVSRVPPASTRARAWCAQRARQARIAGLGRPTAPAVVVALSPRRGRRGAKAASTGIKC